MASNNVILAAAFDPTAINFGTLEKNRKGGKVVYLSPPGNPKSRIVIQTPALSIPFGVSPYMDPAGEIQSYSLDVSFRGYDSDPKMAEFMAKMRQLDDVLLNTAVERSKEWFGKPMGRELVAEFFRRLVKDPSNPQYAPIMKIKVPLANGESLAQFFDESRKPCSIDYLVKGSVVKCIVELSSVWFVNKNFGTTWRLVQCAVVSRPNRLDGYSFQDDQTQADNADQANKAAAEPMVL